MNEKKNEKRMIDLTKVQLREIDGTLTEVDMSKDISRNLYGQAQTLEVVTGCLDLFKTGQCEYSDEMKDAVLQLLENSGTGYVLRTAVMDAIG